MPPPTPGRKVYRSAYMPYLLVGMSLFFAVLTIVGVVRGEGRNVDELWFQIGGWALVVGMVAAGLGRGAQIGAYPTREHLRIRNSLRTTDVPWRRIERFELGSHLGNPRTGQVVLKDGDTIPIVGIAANILEGLGGRQQSQKLIDELNELLERKRSNTDPS